MRVAWTDAGTKPSSLVLPDGPGAVQRSGSSKPVGSHMAPNILQWHYQNSQNAQSSND